MQSQAQARPRPHWNAGLVQPIETLKYRGQLFLLVFLLLRGDDDFRIGKAVCRRIFQNVVEYAGQLHRIVSDSQIFIRMENGGISFYGQDEVKLVRHLHQHIVEVGLLLFQ